MTTETAAIRDTTGARSRVVPTSRRWPLILTALSVPSSIVLALVLGSVSIPLSEVLSVLAGREIGNDSWRTILVDLRMPRAVTAAAAGAALAASGLLLQTLFRNPLAEPYLLGVSSGATLGVASIVLTTGWTARLTSAVTPLAGLGIAGAAAAGAAAVLLLMLALAWRIKNNIAILLIGVMLGAFASAFVTLLINTATPQAIQAFAVWQSGSFRGVGWQHMPILVAASGASVMGAFAIAPALNLLLLGPNYAKSMGVNVRTVRIVALVSASIAVGTVTAFCGPIGFLGLAVPHIARRVLGDSDHRTLLPATVCLGATTALLCSVVSELPGTGITSTIPVNAVTAFVGAPVVIWVFLRMRFTSHDI